MPTPAFWRMLVRRAARRHGFADPLLLMGRLRKFARPSRVHEPIELLRAGATFHTRGLLNTRVFQYNLDWIWPYWVARQYDPLDVSFLPRAFSFSHVNLTHRNWTAVGLPGMDRPPIVDPRGLVTLPDPHGWSLDWWFIPESASGEHPVFPSRAKTADQQLRAEDSLVVSTTVAHRECELATNAQVEAGESEGAPPLLRLEACIATTVPGRLFLAVRPANPDGVAEVGAIETERDALLVDGRQLVHLSTPPDGYVASAYGKADLHRQLHTLAPTLEATCPAGLATAAAVFDVSAHSRFTARALIPLAAVPPNPRIRTRAENRSRARSAVHVASPRLETWADVREGTSALLCPDKRWEHLHRTALDTLVLLSPGDIHPGPWTYRRFWFRDACLMMHAMLAAGLHDRVARALQAFPARQQPDGFFHSQEGEWDSNGQVLWISDLFERHTDRRLDAPVSDALARGADWIGAKRIQDPATDGLFPPGFSAEHLGPVDQYYWDDFWGVAGLLAAARIAARRGDADTSARRDREAKAFSTAIRKSLAGLPPSVSELGIPATPHRRMDAGAVGSLVADYPLRLPGFDTAKLVATADWLRRNCCATGGFFQDMIHSGTNAYLTLALAQTFLRHGDPRYMGLVRRTAELASPTGQWPEAIHPRTNGGCMGDGQHGWAAAEWILMVRALFVREEDDHLVLGSGIPSCWLHTRQPVSYGPTSTPWGKIAIRLSHEDDAWRLHVDADWHTSVAPPRLVVAIPGFDRSSVDGLTSHVALRPSAARSHDALASQ
ncbi:hypothetical protein [Congregicoccus parvus]|uniref:hypothetical protein n=1 Tax=Congregicoccus parvus TaxID=3081749 RepID=UPI003FA5B314